MPSQHTPPNTVGAQSHFTVPVIVDSVKKMDEFAMTRCVYFSIECDTPEEGWWLAGFGMEIPFMMMGLSGVIAGPSPQEGPEFLNTRMIDDLFDRIEDVTGLFVDTNDVWIPNRLVRRGEARRGEVYRLRQNLFNVAIRFRRGLMSDDQFQAKTGDMVESVRFSEAETGAFADWSRSHILAAQEDYHANREIFLPRKGAPKWESE